MFFRRKPKTKTAGNPHGFHLRFQNRPLPSAGAMSYANLSLGLPAYSPIGPAVAIRKPLRETSAPNYAMQGISPVAIVQAGTLTGQIITQPLLDPSVAQNLNISIEGVSHFNVIPNGMGI
jgi:hypothetical protein